MTDETKEISNEESQTDVEQSAAPETNADVVSEDSAEESESVRREAESASEDKAVLDSTETSAEDVAPEEATAQSSTEEQPPAATEDLAQEAGEAPQADEPRTEGSEQTTEPESDSETGAALVEMLDAPMAEGEDRGQTTEDSEQPTESAEVPGAPSSDLGPPSSEESLTVESVIEAILFATDEPLPEGKLAGIVETTGKQIRESIESLNVRYEANHNAFRIEQIAGGYQMLTQPIYNSWLKKMLRVRSDSKLSPAAMETLAIIAYKQPIIRADIEAIRGVAVGEVIRSLMYKGLVKIAGRAEILGRPMLYGTTKKFLEIFGLNSIKDLPKAEDLKNPDRG